MNDSDRPIDGDYLAPGEGLPVKPPSILEWTQCDRCRWRFAPMALLSPRCVQCKQPVVAAKSDPEHTYQRWGAGLPGPDPFELNPTQPWEEEREDIGNAMWPEDAESLRAIDAGKHFIKDEQNEV